MADDDTVVEVVPSRPVSAMGIEFEPDLEAPLLGTLEAAVPPSRLAPLLVLLAFIIIVIALASMMGNLSFRSDLQSSHPPRPSIQPRWQHPDRPH